MFGPVVTTGLSAKLRAKFRIWTRLKEWLSCAIGIHNFDPHRCLSRRVCLRCSRRK